MKTILAICLSGVAVYTAEADRLAATKPANAEYFRKFALRRRRTAEALQAQVAEAELYAPDQPRDFNED